jgi:hypothetical protein
MAGRPGIPVVEMDGIRPVGGLAEADDEFGHDDGFQIPGRMMKIE